MRRSAVLSSVLVSVLVTAGLALAGHHTWHTFDTHWAWKRADLDRNELNLASYRGAATGQQLAGSVEHGEVVGYGGRSDRGQVGDAYVVVRYEEGPSAWSAEVKQVCYQFTIPDGYDVAFDETGCPA